MHQSHQMLLVFVKFDFFLMYVNQWKVLDSLPSCDVILRDMEDPTLQTRTGCHSSGTDESEQDLRVRRLGCTLNIRSQFVPSSGPHFLYLVDACITENIWNSGDLQGCCLRFQSVLLTGSPALNIPICSQICLGRTLLACETS